MRGEKRVNGIPPRQLAVESNRGNLVNEVSSVLRVDGKHALRVPCSLRGRLFNADGARQLKFNYRIVSGPRFVAARHGAVNSICRCLENSRLSAFCKLNNDIYLVPGSAELWLRLKTR